MSIEPVFYKKDKGAIYDAISEADTAIGRQIMVNKEFRRLLTQIIIDEVKKKSVVYKGSVIIGSVGGEPKSEVSSLQNLKDEFTVDLISNMIKKSSKCDNPNQQCLYKSVQDYLRANSPEEKTINIYYIADAHGEEEEVHWNCVIVDGVENRIVLYDPSTQGGYDFSKTKRDAFLSELAEITKIPVYTIVFDMVQQIFCDPYKYPGADIFCQSWVMLFSSVYILDMLDKFSKINFAKLQSLPLKMWLICMFKKHNKKLAVESYGLNVQAFFKYAIIDTTKKSKNYEVALVPKIVNCGKKKPIAFSVVENFSDADSNQTYRLKIEK